jgi:hypothetical protein
MWRHVSNVPPHSLRASYGNGMTMNWKQILPADVKLFLKRFLRPTPMQCVLAGLRTRGIRLCRLDALEVFAFEGAWHTRDYARRVRSLEAWEIEPACEDKLRANLPQAVIKIVDSYAEIRTTPKKFGLVVVDNPFSVYGPGDSYCEHFPLFPAVFRVLKNEAVLVLNVVPAVSASFRAKYPYVFNAPHLAARRAFYQTDTPERLDLDELAAAYARHAAASGFVLQWYFEQERTNSDVRYLALKLDRRRAAAA